MKTIESIAEVSPFRSYRVFARNRDYTGESFGIKFNGGEAFVYALPSGASDRQRDRRVASLGALLDAEPILKQVDARTFRKYRAYVISEIGAEDFAGAEDAESADDAGVSDTAFTVPSDEPEDDMPEAPSIPEAAFEVDDGEHNDVPAFEVLAPKPASRPRSRVSA